ncbi:MAG: bifunctional 4-hydroxy-2-oxoglutarate aldolase/2-dehydro-3-deoxy-phosphogluconate aldolase [Massilibacteroides sp.]|nr:bifunctional 4-hydroxy-2-oxoglutarate aldolase/2-dehydro-3-deoxy-phosphogluconate aldolase [Massilibacteroides sp.]
MARFSFIDTLNVMIKTSMVPVFYNKDLEVSKNILRACYKGGVRAFEFTNRGDKAHQVFDQLIDFAAEECPDMVLGVGSVVEPATAAIYIQLGANFVVGPCFNGEVSKLCNRRGIPYIPGCGSVTEIGNAQESGCVVCKVFPAGNVGGPSFVKNVKAPLPWSMLMVTGAVAPTKENLTEWIQAGVACVGMGSKLFPKEIVAKGEWNKITDLCCAALGYINEARKK